MDNFRNEIADRKIRCASSVAHVYCVRDMAIRQVELWDHVIIQHCVFIHALKIPFCLLDSATRQTVFALVEPITFPPENHHVCSRSRCPDWIPRPKIALNNSARFACKNRPTRLITIPLRFSASDGGKGCPVGNSAKYFPTDISLSTSSA